MLRQLPRLSPALLAFAAVAATGISQNANADLVMHFNPRVLTHQFSDGTTSGGLVPAAIGDQAGFVTDVRSPTPGGSDPPDAFIDVENNGAPEIVGSITHGSLWEFSGDDNLLGRKANSGNQTGVDTLLDTNTITTIFTGKLGTNATGVDYLYDFRDDAGESSNQPDGFALRYDYTTGMLEGLAKQEVNASIAAPTGEWFVATYAWNGASSSATLSIETMTGYTASDTGAASSDATDVDLFRFGTSTDGDGNKRMHALMGDIMVYNDVLDHSAEVNQLKSDYFNIPELLIDRATGAMTISNNGADLTDVIGYMISSPLGALDYAEWQSIADNYDASGGGSTQVDPDNNWTKLSDPTSRTDLSEVEFESNGGANNGADFLNGETTNLGNAWRQYFVEDVTMELLFDNGDVLPLEVRYTGDALRFGDLDFDGDIDEDDFYNEFLPNFGADTSALEFTLDRYQLGDLNEDGTVDLDDFIRLNNAYFAANPGGAALSFAGRNVPEPATFALAGVAFFMIAMVFRRQHSTQRVATAKETSRMTCMRSYLVAATALAVFAIGSARTYADLVVHFDPNVLSTQFSDGGTGGGSVPAVIGDTVGFVSDVRSPTPGAAEGGGGDGWHDAEGSAGDLASRPLIIEHPTLGSVWSYTGGQRLLGRESNSGNTDGLDGAMNMNTLTAIVAGRIDLSGSDNGYLFDFRDDAATGGGTNANDGFALRYNHDTGMLEGISKQSVNASVPLSPEDWFVATYAWDGASSSATLSVQTNHGVVLSDTGTAESAALQQDRWRPGSNAANTGDSRYSGLMGDLMFYNDVLDHSDVADQLADDYFDLPRLELMVNRTNGQVYLQNNDTKSVDIDAYQIESALNSLNPSGWSTLDDQSYDGDAWTKLGEATNDVSEGVFGANSTLGPGADLNLGLLFDTSVGEEDLTFQVHIAGEPDGLYLIGEVSYFDGPAGLPGDFNNDGTVDAADYTVWRNNLGAADESALNGNGDGTGGVAIGDYTLWKNNFGNSSLGALGGAVGAVPEPSTIALFGLVAAIAAGSLRRKA